MATATDSATGTGMGKDDATWLNVAYIVFFLLAAFVGYKILETAGLQTGWIERYDWYTYVENFGALILGGVFFYILRSDDERHEYFLASIAELRKVSWPSVADTKKMTWIICLVVAIFAAIVSVFDMIWARALHFLVT